MEIVSSISHVSVPVTDASQVGEARRAANAIAQELRFATEQAGKLAIITTESASNLAKHAKEGELLLCPSVAADQSSRVDVLAIDRGPGIANVPQSLDDGYSTAGSAGNGLGAIARLSDYVEIYSQQASGTVVFSRVYAERKFPRPASDVSGSRLESGFICIPKKGEQVCGDVASVRIGDHAGVFMLSDGLGHGIAANEASREAAKIFSDERNAGPAELLDYFHRGLRATRGAAVAVAQVDDRARTIKYSGVGNIAATILQDLSSRSLISHNGIVGHHSHKIQEFAYPWPDSAMLVMNSDGLQTNWKLSQYPGLLKKHPMVIAAVLYRDFARGRDDVGILVVKQVERA